MATISVVISAFNEEAKIRDCLESVQWADEIVFVDNSSIDDTPKIAKKYTSKLFKRPNNPTMLNVNKNYGIEKSNSDWILYVDADERVTPELREEIKRVLKSHHSGLSRIDSGVAASDAAPQNDANVISGYWIPRKNIIFGKWIEHTGMYPDYQMRLFKKGEGKFPTLHVHEMIEVYGKTQHLNENLLHHNFETISQFLYKHIELYAPNEAQMLLEKKYQHSPLDALRFPVNEFLSRFFAREGYRDGLHGLVLSLLLAFYHLIIFAKIWEKQGFKVYNPPNFLDLVSAQLKKAADEIVYWISNEKLKKSKNLLERYILRVKRKVKS